MIELHAIGLEEMRNIESENHLSGKYEGLPLALRAKDEETLRFLDMKEHCINPSKRERRGYPSVIEYAAGRLDEGMVRFCTNFDIGLDDTKNAIVAAVQAGLRLKASPLETVRNLYRRGYRTELKCLAEVFSKMRTDAIGALSLPLGDNYIEVERVFEGLGEALEFD